MTTANDSGIVIPRVSIICQTCSKWSQAQARGLDKCLAQDGCGSPIVGDTFHEYEGPITDFLRFCFVCGADAKKGVAVKGHRRRIGVCLEHVPFVVGMAPKEQRRLPVLQRTLISDSGEVPAESIIPKKPEKTLGNMMKQLEDGKFEPDS